MANLRLTDLILNGRWPGAINPHKGIPTDGWDNTVDNFKTTSATDVPPIPLGEKRMIYTDNSEAPGWYTMMYLQYNDYSSLDVSGDFSDGNMYCAHIDTTHCVNVGAESRSSYAVVSRCYTAVNCEVTEGAPLAIPCATIDADSSVSLSSGDPASNGFGDAYGWFWIDGVCPAKDVTLFQGTAGSLAGADVTTDTLMRAGDVIACFTGATIELFSSDSTNVLDATSATGKMPTPVGWSCVSTD